MVKCEICKREFSNIRALTTHLQMTHKVKAQAYYDTYVKQDNDGICVVCGGLTSFINISKGYHKYCGGKCTLRSEETKQKRLATLKEKYGPDITNISQVQAIKNKKEETCIKNYGVKNGLLIKEVREKTLRSINTKEAQEKYKQTCLNKFGVENFVYSKEYKKLSDRTRQLHINYMRSQGYIPMSELIEEYGSGWAQVDGFVSKIAYKNKYYINIDDIPAIELYAKQHRWSVTSYKEKLLVKYIKSIYDGEVIENTRKVIYPKELDIYIPEKNLAIEFNGLYWHSTMHNPDIKYHHQDKVKDCEKQNIELIHIYEWELEEPYLDKIMSMINAALGIYKSILDINNCEARVISFNTMKDFMIEYSLDKVKYSNTNYGLYYNDELIYSLGLSFNNNTWIINNFCQNLNVLVKRGYTHLFDTFIKDHNPNEVIWYDNMNKYNNMDFKELNMKFIDYTEPDKVPLINRQPMMNVNLNNIDLDTAIKAILWGAGYKEYRWRK